MKYRILDMDEANERFDVKQHLYGAQSATKMLLVEGDTELDSLNLNGRVEGAYGYIIDGDLIVRGRLNSSDDQVMALLVTGSVRAKLVYSSGADTAILGDLTAERAVVGNYHHGYLKVHGRLTAPWLLNANHQITWGELAATAVDLYHGEVEAPYVHSHEDLVEDLYDPDCEEVDFDALLALVEAGEPFLEG